jgi:hypothetical protein
VHFRHRFAHWQCVAIGWSSWLMEAFFGTPLAIVNVGLASFAEAIKETNLFIGDR